MQARPRPQSEPRAPPRAAPRPHPPCGERRRRASPPPGPGLLELLGCLARRRSSAVGLFRAAGRAARATAPRFRRRRRRQRGDDVPARVAQILHEPPRARSSRPSAPVAADRSVSATLASVEALARLPRIPAGRVGEAAHGSSAGTSVPCRAPFGFPSLCSPAARRRAACPHRGEGRPRAASSARAGSRPRRRASASERRHLRRGAGLAVLLHGLVASSFRAATNSSSGRAYSRSRPAARSTPAAARPVRLPLMRS